MHLFSKKLFISTFLAVTTHVANAGVIVGGTRVIYDGSKKEASLSVNNPDTTPYLIQSWVEASGNDVEKAPFIITPPLYRLGQGEKNVERILLTADLPKGKESLFWINIKAIPSAVPKDNSLQIAVKTRIKLIYRPVDLKGQVPEEQVDKLIWQRLNNKISVSNPTSFIINFNEITVDGKKIRDVGYVLPGSNASFDLPKGVSANTVTFKIINDYGGIGASHNANI